jgi:hypothetical protein
VPAQAYFWDWIDSLSGPEYHGFLVEWKVWCKTDSAVAMMESFRVDLERHRSRYETAANATDPTGTARTIYGLALEAMDQAAKKTDTALGDARTGGADPRVAFAQALALRKVAKVRVDFAREAQKLSGNVEANRQRIDVLLGSARSLKPEKTPDRFHTTRIISGIAVSLCEAGPFERQTRFLSVNFGYGWDTLKQNEAFDNKMVTLGGSYHAVFTPWISAGLGGGIAFFSGNAAPSFQKFYLEPYIFDVRPFAFTQSRYSQNPWPQVVFVRYSTIIFPTGFEAGRFGGVSPQYPAELVHTWGIHFDLDPLIRSARGRY